MHVRRETKAARADAHEEKRLSRPFTVTSSDEKGAIEGHGAVFDNPHPTSSWLLSPEWKDVIRPGSFARTLGEHKKRGTMPVMLYMHERGNVIGAWRDVKEGADGLELKGQVVLSAKAPSGAGIHELLKMGAINGLSIGFRVRKHTLDQEKKVREIHEMDLTEVSVVDDPGNPMARVTDVKSGLRSIQHLETVLREAGLSRNEAKALLAKGFGALRDAEDDPDLREAGGDEEQKKWAALKKSMDDFATLLRKS